MNRRSGVRAVVVGVLVVLLGLVVGAVIVVVAISAGTDLEATPVTLAGPVLSLTFCALGGYVTASLAPRQPVLHAMLAGALVLALMLVFDLALDLVLPSEGNQSPGIISLLETALQVPAAMLGGHVWVRRAA